MCGKATACGTTKGLAILPKEITWNLLRYWKSSSQAHTQLTMPWATLLLHSLRQTNRVTLFFIYLFLHLSQALVETSHCWQVLRVWLHPKLKQPLNACSKTAYFKTTFSLCRVKHCFKSTIFIFLFICSIPLEAWELHGRNVCTSVVFCAFLPSFFLGDGGVWGGGDLESLSQHAVPSQEDKSAHNLPTVTPSWKMSSAAHQAPQVGSVQATGSGTYSNSLVSKPFILRIAFEMGV